MFWPKGVAAAGVCSDDLDAPNSDGVEFPDGAADEVAGLEKLPNAGVELVEGAAEVAEVPLGPNSDFEVLAEAV